MKRSVFDRSHFSFMVGRIGRVQTLTAVPVVAGDSFELMLEGVLRLAPLRRYLSMDAQVDLLAYYRPHRHEYGDDWIAFVEDGIKESVTFTGINAAGATPVGCLGMKAKDDNAIPRWLPGAQTAFWNRYIRPPTWPDVPDNKSVVTHNLSLKTYPALSGTAAVRQLKYGPVSALPKTPWSTAVESQLSPADREVTVASSKFDILNLNRVRKQYRTEILRQWFQQRYKDVLDNWGADVNIDADERPELINRRTMYMSGRDIDGVGDANLGSYSGKSDLVVKFGHPRKYFPEHGVYAVVLLVRFPLVLYDERHPLAGKVNPTYLELAADPNLWPAEPPAPLAMSDWFSTDAVTEAGQLIPFGQWYRYHPSVAHEDFRTVQGFPFYHLSDRGTSASEVPQMYRDDKPSPGGNYDDMFQTLQLQHWTSQMRVGLQVHSFIPSVERSIFAGA